MENGRSRLQRAQEDVEEVKDIMLDNLKKADERSGKLEDLEDRADQLLAKSRAFEKTANQVKQKKRQANTRMKVVGIAVAVVIAAIVVGIIVYFIVGG